MGVAGGELLIPTIVLLYGWISRSRAACPWPCRYRRCWSPSPATAATPVSPCSASNAPSCSPWPPAQSPARHWRTPPRRRAQCHPDPVTRRSAHPFGDQGLAAPLRPFASFGRVLPCTPCLPPFPRCQRSLRLDCSGPDTGGRPLTLGGAASLIASSGPQLYRWLARRIRRSDRDERGSECRLWLTSAPLSHFLPPS